MENSTVGFIKDGYLQTFIGTVEKVDAEIGITLNVSGTIITGNLVSRQRYWQGVVEDFKSSENETARLIGESLGDFEAEDENESPEENVQDDTDFEQFNFIHLKNATFLTNGKNIPTNRGVHWRGRVDSVDGFTLGNLGVQDEDY